MGWFDGDAPTGYDRKAQMPYRAQQQAAGNWATGGRANDVGLLDRDPLFQNLDRGEALAKRQRDFGLGAANNAETKAMLQEASATGAKYSGAFGDLAASNAARAEAAGNRGLDIYRGDTGAYQQGLTNAADSRGRQTGAYDAIMAFANAPQGPSAAQAQLAQSTLSNEAQALALARSGRGLGGGQAALRSAIGQNALTQQQAAAQAAELRANEYTAYQNQKLNALGAAGGLATQTAGTDQGLGQLGLAGAQYGTDTALKGTQLNDASAQAWANAQAQAYQQALAAEMGSQTQKLNVESTALTGRENEYASANSTNATEKGLAQSAAIADANRQQAYTGAALSAGGTVIGALSDERSKQNITPLGMPQAMPSQSNGSVAGTVGSSMPKAEDQTGSTVGKVGGAAVGSAVAGPLGGIVGSAIGGMLGKKLSDVRSKKNVLALDSGAGFDSGNGFIPLQQELPEKSPRELSEENRTAYDQLEEIHRLEAKYQGAPRAASAADVARYANQKKPAAEKQAAKAEVLESRQPREPNQSLPPEQISRISRELDEAGQNLSADPLAASARAIPGYAFDYKNPTEPGAKPGRQVGPMAQDLAANPLTQGTVVKSPNGKLAVDTPRLTLYNTATQHSQQKQTDKLKKQVADLESLILPQFNRKGDYSNYSPNNRGALR